MFYEEQSINEKLLCPFCQTRFQDPVLLPCVEFICQKCILSYIEERADKLLNTFKCCICDENHAIPSNGFPKSKRMSILLTVKPKKVYTTSGIETLKAEINNCFEKINYIRSQTSEKEKFVEEFFDLKQQQINQITESKIFEINRRSRELLDQMDRLKSEQLESLRGGQQQQSNNEESDHLKKAEAFCMRWMEKLSSSEIVVDSDDDQDLQSFQTLLDKKRTQLDSYNLSANQIDFVSNEDELKSTVLGKIKTKGQMQDICYHKKLDISSNLDLIENFLLDLNQFRNGCVVATYVKYLTFIQRNTSCNNNFNLDVCIFNANECGIRKKFNVLNTFMRREIDHAVTRSLSNGTHILISIFFETIRAQYLIVVSNEPAKKYEFLFSTDLECKISIDTDRVYAINTCEQKIDVYDLTLKAIESIDFKPNFVFMFDPAVSIKICDELLYACSNNQVQKYRLPDLKLIQSFNISLAYLPISRQLIEDYAILRYRDHLKYINLNNGTISSRGVIDLDLSDSSLQMRALDDDTFIFFNTKKNEFFASS